MSEIQRAPQPSIRGVATKLRKVLSGVGQSNLFNQRLSGTGIQMCPCRMCQVWRSPQWGQFKLNSSGRMSLTLSRSVSMPDDTSFWVTGQLNNRIGITASPHQTRDCSTNIPHYFHSEKWCSSGHQISSHRFLDKFALGYRWKLRSIDRRRERR